MQTQFHPCSDWLKCSKCGSSTQCKTTTGVPVCMQCNKPEAYDLVAGVLHVMQANSMNYTRKDAEDRLNGQSV